MLQQPREELLKESGETGMRKRTNCCVVNILIGGIFTTALIDTGAEVTCLSEGFVNKNKERLQVGMSYTTDQWSKPSETNGRKSNSIKEANIRRRPAAQLLNPGRLSSGSKTI